MTDDCLEEVPCRYYWTLPLGAIPYRAAWTSRDQTNEPEFVPNEAMFEGRHTYALSTPSYRAELDWLVVLGRSGWWIPQFSGSDDILSEKGVFDIGSDVVMIKPSMRQITLQVRLPADDSKNWQQVRQQLSYIFSWEHATSVDPDNDNLYPSAFDKPNPFTITLECYDANNVPIRYHADIAVAWLSGDEDNGENNKSLATDIIMLMSDPRFYGDEVSYFLDGGNLLPVPDDAVPDDSNIISPGSPGIPVGTFRYSGTARSGFDMKFRVEPLVGNPQIHMKEIVLVDETNPTNFRWSRFSYWDYPTRGWNDFPLSTDQSEYEFSSEGRYLRRMDLATGTIVLEDNLQNFANIPIFQDWTSLMFIPGHIYSVRFVLEGNAQEPGFISTGFLTYRERYTGV